MANSAASSDQTCACGSGLKAERCCALDWSRPWLRETPAQIAGKARAAFAAGDKVAAERLLIEAIEAAPLDARALGALYEHRATQPVAAEALLTRIARLEPDNAAPAMTLAHRLAQRGAFHAAEPHARAAARLAPANPEAHALLGMIYTETQREPLGEPCYRRALALSAKPRADLVADLAWNLRGQGRMAESRRLFEQAHALDPARFNTVYGWARMEEADRQFDSAAQLLDIAERLAPGHPFVALQRAVLLNRAGDGEAALAALEALEHRIGAGGAGLRLAVLKEKGALLDRLARHDEAFAAFAASKQTMLALTGQSYLADAAAEQARRLKAVFTRDRMAALPRAGVRTDVPQPIFIVGFPRTGTTMIEQTLSAHPRISAGDELPVIGELVETARSLLGGALPYPEVLASVSREGLEALRDRYLDRAREYGAMAEGSDWFTDKMPLNETHLGLIGLIFPSAPIIHLIRHPLDVALSTFANQMTHGFYCASDLDSIARHYLLTLDLVDHYRAEIAPNCLAVRYEDVIDDQETRVREMLAFIGAEFDPRCLAFHENHRYARTASYAQVAEKLYGRSRYRWRGYREQLAPVIPMLEPAIRRLGYELS
jgi:tetratricopeptide (TPR) repeat protein